MFETTITSQSWSVMLNHDPSPPQAHALTSEFAASALSFQLDDSASSKHKSLDSQMPRTPVFLWRLIKKEAFFRHTNMLRPGSSRFVDSLKWELFPSVCHGVSLRCRDAEMQIPGPDSNESDWDKSRGNLQETMDHPFFLVPSLPCISMMLHDVFHTHRIHVCYI